MKQLSQQRYVKSSIRIQKSQMRPYLRCVYKTSKIFMDGEVSKFFESKVAYIKARRYKKNKGSVMKNIAIIHGIYAKPFTHIISLTLITAYEDVFYYPHFRYKKIETSRGQKFVQDLKR